MIITSENILFGGEIKMKGVAMYYTVKTMLEHGKSISAIARDLGIDRKDCTQDSRQGEKWGNKDSCYEEKK